MYVIYKLVPIKKCPNPPDWTFHNEKMYGKFVEGTVTDEESAKNRVETLEIYKADDDYVYYYSKE